MAGPVQLCPAVSDIEREITRSGCNQYRLMADRVSESELVEDIRIPARAYGENEVGTLNGTADLVNDHTTGEDVVRPD